MVTAVRAVPGYGAPTERALRGDLVCVLCTRTVARVEGTWGRRFVPRKLWVRDGEHGEVVRRLRCPHCGGNLALDNQQEIYIAPAVLDAEREQAQMPARRGRPPKQAW
jgi:hypothetical protein